MRPQPQVRLHLAGCRHAQQPQPQLLQQPQRARGCRCHGSRCGLFSQGPAGLDLFETLACRTPLFFAKKDLGLALADIVGLLGVLGATIVEFKKVWTERMSCGGQMHASLNENDPAKSKNVLQSCI